MAYTKEDCQRDCNPIPEARLAQCIYGARYAYSGLGCMGFWDRLEEDKKSFCTRVVADVIKAAKAHSVIP